MNECMVLFFLGAKHFLGNDWLFSFKKWFIVFIRFEIKFNKYLFFSYFLFTTIQLKNSIFFKSSHILSEHGINFYTTTFLFFRRTGWPVSRRRIEKRACHKNMKSMISFILIILFVFYAIIYFNTLTISHRLPFFL